MSPKLPVAGFDEVGDEGIPRPEVHDPGVDEEDRRTVPVAHDVEAASGNGDGAGLGRHRPILPAGSG